MCFSDFSEAHEPLRNAFVSSGIRVWPECGIVEIFSNAQRWKKFVWIIHKSEFERPQWYNAENTYTISCVTKEIGQFVRTFLYVVGPRTPRYFHFLFFFIFFLHSIYIYIYIHMHLYFLCECMYFLAFLCVEPVLPDNGISRLRAYGDTISDHVSFYVYTDRLRNANLSLYKVFDQYRDGINWTRVTFFLIFLNGFTCIIYVFLSSSC